VRSQARFVKSGRKAMRPYTPNVADIVLGFGISEQLQVRLLTSNSVSPAHHFGNV